MFSAYTVGSFVRLRKKQIALVQNFAAQAVIAIENARLLSELREIPRAADGHAEVLEVISSSPGELEPVFDALLANATKLCEATYGAMWLRDGADVRNVAFYGKLPEEFEELWHAGAVIPADAEAPVARCIRGDTPVYVPDLKEDQAYRDGTPLVRDAVDLAGMRTLVAVPLLKEGGGNIGSITIYRREVKPFSESRSRCAEMFAFTVGYLVAPVRAFDSSCASLRRAVACASVGLFAKASRTRRSSSGEWNNVHHCAGTSIAGLKCCAAPAGPAVLAVWVGCGEPKCSFPPWAGRADDSVVRPCNPPAVR